LKKARLERERHIQLCEQVRRAQHGRPKQGGCGWQAALLSCQLEDAAVRRGLLVAREGCGEPS